MALNSLKHWVHDLLFWFGERLVFCVNKNSSRDTVSLRKWNHYLLFFRVQVVSAIEIAICVGDGSSCSKSPFYKIYNRKKYETLLNPRQVKNVNCCSMDIKMQLIQEASMELCTACTAWVQWALHTILAWQSHTSSFAKTCREQWSFKTAEGCHEKVVHVKGIAQSLFLFFKTLMIISLGCLY